MQSTLNRRVVLSSLLSAGAGYWFGRDSSSSLSQVRSGTATLYSRDLACCDDPSGLERTLKRVSGWRPGKFDRLRIELPEGHFLCRRPIRITHPFGRLISISGRSLAVPRLRDKPLLKVTNQSNSEAGVIELGAVSPVGLPSVGDYVKIRCLYATTKGRGRVRELAGVHRVVASNRESRTFSLLLRHRSPVEESLIGGYLMVTSVRAIKTVFYFDLDQGKSDKGGFEIETATSLDDVCIVGTGINDNDPSLASARKDRRVDGTCGILGLPGSFVRLNGRMGIADWGEYGIQALGGCTVDTNDLAISGCTTNGVYGQHRSVILLPRAAITGCGSAIVSASSTHVEVSDGVLSGNARCAMALDGGSIWLSSTCYLSSSRYAFVARRGRISAKGAQLDNISVVSDTDGDSQVFT